MRVLLPCRQLPGLCEQSVNAATKTHYDALGAPRTATHAELRRAYVGLARKFHPDFHIADPAAAQERAAARMRRINEAWSILGDAHRREVYDKSLGGPFVANTAAPPDAGAPAAHPAAEQASGHRPSKWAQVLPVALLAFAFLCFAVGFVANLLALLAIGLGCALLGGIAFVLVPMMTAVRSRNKAPA